MRWILPLIFIAALGLTACSHEPGPAPRADEALWVAPDMAAQRARFQPHELTASLGHLAAGDREALPHLIRAARAVDTIFWLQAWPENPELAARVAELEGPLAEPARDYYRIMYGPWDRLEEFEPFLGTVEHPDGAGFYPPDMTAAEFEAWLAAHPEDRDAFRSLFTVIRREGDRLVAVPYREVYRPLLETAAAELRAAADLVTSPSLASFLELRAEALLTDDYYASDLAWMDVESPLEVVIGPYEVYEDRLFGYKAAYEAFITIVDPSEGTRLDRYKGELPWLEQHLPIPDEHKNLERGSESPIKVADEIFTAGDTRAGVQTLAFNLPNDERVREAKGSKKVMLKNMIEAKYEAILEPIASRVLVGSEADRVDFDAYYHFILFHELSHGLGPGLIEVDGRPTEVRLELKELYPAIEEAKADVLGALHLYQLNAKAVVPDAVVAPLPWTYTAGLFRSARFGVTEAHGLGVVIQTSFLLEAGALEVTPDGRFRPVPERFEAALAELAHELLMVQAVGSYDGAVELVRRYGQLPAAMGRLLESLDDVPVDVDPSYPVAEQLAPVG